MMIGNHPKTQLQAWAWGGVVEYSDISIILTTILILNSLRELKFTCFVGP
jgi:hypothetical protein